MKENEQLFSLENGRVYSVLDTRRQYSCKVGQFNATEIEDGGFIIRAKLSNGEWGYICHAENQEGVDNFIHAAKRLNPLPEDYYKNN